MMKSKTAKKAEAAPPRLIYKPQVLDLTGVSFPALWEWMRQGKFPVPREVGNKVAWLESEVYDWIKNRPQRQYKTVKDSILDKRSRASEEA
jgi:predicted DNA-binding transcriptional regulator AlpA